MTGREGERNWQAQEVPAGATLNLDATGRFSEELRQQRMAQSGGDQRAGQQQQAGGPVWKQNTDGTVTARFKDGEVTFDRSTNPPRPIEYVNLDGEKVSFKYDGNSTKPSSFVIKDKDGKELSSGKRGEKDSEWTIKNSKAGNGPEDDLKNITEVGINRDGNLAFVEKNGLVHERCRNGNNFRRDDSGRILVEQTPGGRVTEFTYEGKNDQPATITVKDAKGNISEHGVNDGKAWSIYRPAAGEASLDPKKLTDPAKKFEDPVDGVKDVRVNQANGMRLEVHNNGDLTWKDDTREFRRNPSGGMEIVRQTADGKFQLASFKDADGLTTKYEYDDKGKVKSQTTVYPNGKESKLERQGDKDEWKKSDGSIVKAKIESLDDGSIVTTDLEKNGSLTQTAKGAELIRRLDKDGQNRLYKSTDPAGRTIQYGYEANGELTSLIMSQRVRDQQSGAIGEQTVLIKKTGVKDGVEKWDILPQVSEKEEQVEGKRVIRPVWGEKLGEFEGSYRILEDGSLVRTAKDEQQDLISIRGLNRVLKPKK